VLPHPSPQPPVGATTGRTPPGASVEVRGLTVRHGAHAALVEVDLVVEPARLLVLTGPNGSGKSTLLEVLAGVRRPTSGQVRRAAASVAFVPQRTAVPDHLPVTLHDVVTMGVWGGLGPWRRVGREARARVRAAEERLDLDALVRRPFSALSGGERQRALLAQALARGADLLLLDEPTTGLDEASATRICDAICDEVARGTTVVCPTHDPVVVERADRVVGLQRGRVSLDR